MRSRHEVIADILLTAAWNEEGSSKTFMINKSNLSFDQIEKYLPFLEDIKLLKLNYKNSRYKITQKGFKYLESYNDIKELLSGK